LTTDIETKSAGRLRRWGWRLFCLVLVPVLLLAILEGVLRVSGCGHSTAYFLEREVAGERYFVANRYFYEQFYSEPVKAFCDWDSFEFSVPAVKPPNTYRVFVLGSSAAYGSPPAPDFSFWRTLEVMLRKKYPAIRFEVYCVAMPGSNSYVM